MSRTASVKRSFFSFLPLGVGIMTAGLILDQIHTTPLEHGLLWGSIALGTDAVIRFGARTVCRIREQRRRGHN